MNQIINAPLKTLAIFVAMTAMGGCVVHVGGDNRQPQGWDSDSEHRESQYAGRSVSAVNRRLVVDDHAHVARVDNVNGDIHLGQHVRVGSGDNVNGDIEADQHLVAEGNLTTVNGDIEIDAHGKVEGRLETVNGDIHLRSTRVAKSIITYNGDVDLTGETHIQGDIVFERSRKSRVWLFPFGELDMTPDLVIDSNVRVDGAIILNRKVNLDIRNEALLAKVEKNYYEE